jgi:hypothetical protein
MRILLYLGEAINKLGLPGKEVADKPGLSKQRFEFLGYQDFCI